MFAMAHLLIGLLILAGIAAIVGIILHQFGIKIPPWFIQILWVVLLVVIGVIAARILLGLV